MLLPLVLLEQDLRKLLITNFAFNWHWIAVLQVSGSVPLIYFYVTMLALEDNEITILVWLLVDHLIVGELYLAMNWIFASKFALDQDFHSFHRLFIEKFHVGIFATVRTLCSFWLWLQEFVLAQLTDGHITFSADKGWEVVDDIVTEAACYQRRVIRNDLSWVEVRTKLLWDSSQIFILLVLMNSIKMFLH